MSKVFFSKYVGLGNDFILIEDLSQSFPVNQVSKLCDRNWGIGADGLILVQKDTRADFRMRIFNRDGSEAESCGNGLRCFLQFLVDLGYPAKKTSIRIGKKIVNGDFVNGLISIEMGPVPPITTHMIDPFKLYFLNTGVPHAVVFSDQFESAPLIRHHAYFKPSGANVNFAQINNQSISVRTFERGVETETLACGTGACAVAAVANQVYGVASPIQISFPGGNVEIQISNDQICMIGQALKVFNGTIQLYRSCFINRFWADVKLSKFADLK